MLQKGILLLIKSGILILQGSNLRGFLFVCSVFFNPIILELDKIHRYTDKLCLALQFMRLVRTEICPGLLS